MPYIPQPQRTPYNGALDTLGVRLCQQPQGHLTYALYYTAVSWAHGQNLSHQSLSNAAAELRRRLLDPLVNRKRDENGDI